MSNDPGYSVVVVTHNHAATLAACMGAITRLEPPPERVVVVDNASSDPSADVVETRSRSLPLRLIRRSTNTGFAAATNAGIHLTNSSWVLLLNPDCAPDPRFVARIFEGLGEVSDPDRVGSATGKLLRADGPDLAAGDTIDSAGMVVSPSGRHFDRGAGSVDRGRFDRRAWVFGGTGAAVLLRRSALEDVAYPDGQVFCESFFAYREDAELAWRLQWRGWSCLYEPEAVAAHRRGFRPEAGRRGHAAINRHSVRNRFLLRLHCADAGWHWRFLPWWLPRDVLVLAACCTVERSSLPAFGDLWQLRHDAGDRRRWVMDRRTAPPRQLRRWFRRRGWVEEIESR
jgi:GT2 family glycosyltransferase